MLLFIFYVLFFSLLLTGDITGGEAFFFSDDFAGIFSSPETPPGGGQPRFSSSSTFCFLSSPHRRHYRGGGILSLSFFFFAGKFSSPETPPGGGQPCFSASLRRRLVRGTNAQHFWLSLSMGVHELGHERQGSCLNSVFWKTSMNTSMLLEIWPHLKDNGRLESLCTRTWTPVSLRQLLLCSLSSTIQTVLDLCTALVDSLSTVRCATLRESGNLRPFRAGCLGRGRRYLLTSFSLYSHGRLPISALFFWTRHRLPLRKSRDCGNFRSLLWWSTNLDAGARVSSTFVVRN